MYCIGTIPDSDTQEGAAAMLCGTAKMRRTDQEKQNICEKISHFSLAIGKRRSKLQVTVRRPQVQAALLTYV